VRIFIVGEFCNQAFVLLVHELIEHRKVLAKTYLLKLIVWLDCYFVDRRLLRVELLFLLLHTHITLQAFDVLREHRFPFPILENRNLRAYNLVMVVIFFPNFTDHFIKLFVIEEVLDIQEFPASMTDEIKVVGISRTSKFVDQFFEIVNTRWLDAMGIPERRYLLFARKLTKNGDVKPILITEELGQHLSFASREKFVSELLFNHIILIKE
jgi:hypothetical protein